MPETKQFRPRANVLSNSNDVSLESAAFNTAANDVFVNSTVNYFNAPSPELSQAQYTFALAEEGPPKKQDPTAGSESETDASLGLALRSAHWFRGLVSHRRRQAVPLRRARRPGGAQAGHPPSYDSDTPPLTPGSSSASSPFSSLEDLTLSSAEDLGPHFLQSADLTTPHEYVRSMIKTGKGLPVYMPKPIEPYCDVLVGVVPGDVGTYHPGEGFKRIANLYAAVESGDLPAGLPEREIAVDEQEIPEGHVLSEGASSRKTRSRADKSMVSSFDFTCDSQRGAIYVATSSAKLEELVNPARLRKYIIRNAKAIYEYADSIREVDDDNPLYIVTGCIKSDSYAIAAFRETDKDLMSLENFTCSGDATPTYDWTSLPRSGEGKFGASGERGLKNQTLFLRGFKLDFSKEFRIRMRSLSHSWDGAPNDSPFDPSKGPRPAGDSDRQDGTSRGAGGGGGSGSGWSSSARFTNNTNLRGGSQDEEAPVDTSIFDHPEDEVNVYSFPVSGQDTCHPSDAINKYLLDVTGENFALCHDDEWRFAIKDLEAPDDLIRHIVEVSEIVTSHGVALLSQGGSDDEVVCPSPSPVMDAHSLSTALTIPTVQPSTRSVRSPSYPATWSLQDSIPSGLRSDMGSDAWGGPEDQGPNAERSSASRLPSISRWNMKEVGVRAFPDSSAESCHPCDPIDEHLSDVTGADLWCFFKPKTALLRRFERIGDLDDLALAISLSTKATRLISEGHLPTTPRDRRTASRKPGKERHHQGINRYPRIAGCTPPTPPLDGDDDMFHGLHSLLEDPGTTLLTEADLIDMAEAARCWAATSKLRRGSFVEIYSRPLRAIEAVLEHFYVPEPLSHMSGIREVEGSWETRGLVGAICPERFDHQWQYEEGSRDEIDGGEYGEGGEVKGERGEVGGEGARLANAPSCLGSERELQDTLRPLVDGLSEWHSDPEGVRQSEAETITNQTSGSKHPPAM